MRNFNLGSLSEWEQVAVGEVIDLDIPTSGYRKVELDVMADSNVLVRVVTPEQAWLIGEGSGHMTCSFGIAEPAGLVIFGDPDADVFIRSRTKTQIIPESQDPSYTTIEPREAGPSDEVRRMMHIVQLNQRRREQLLLDQIAKLTRPKEQPAAAAPAAPLPAGVEQAVVDDLEEPEA